MNVKEGEVRDDREVRRLRNQLVKSIYSFIRTEIHFSMRRLLAADIKDLYIGRYDRSDDLVLTKDLKRNKLFNECANGDYSRHPIKGGLQIRPYLTYNCLKSSASQSTQKLLRKDWKCESCGKEWSLTPLEQIRHSEQCKPMATTDSRDDKSGAGGEDGEATTSGTDTYDPLKVLYTCDECQQKLLLTSTQILRHKRDHRLNAADVTAEPNVL
ncbi:unnamed protein product [Medioppia subpectinata]|uniref:DHX34-like C2H2-type zinc finger domain-containing protein n=1 Tax=Medioppia subpectinata TaxID=1979941 RepID=A0A7R9KT53_9ACAR|nr:unnamed protein product [Medioppia subpectinata]CAG2109030.1 unnamed protein product [Medioppia subpectinata]